MTEPNVEPTTHRFQAEVTQILRLVINSLYSNKEIFLRELVSNASDALDKLRFEAITRQELLAGDDALSIRISADAEAKTLTISDNGIGMSHDELVRNLGTVAHSGSREFLQKLSEGGDLKLIGQFGVGFYSAWLVAERVDVVSRAAGSQEAWRWSSDARETFTVEPAERGARGTDITLHLQEAQQEYLDEWKLRGLIGRYSDFVNHPIQLQVTRTEGEGDEAREETTFETVNQASALWQRPADEVTDAQYEELYRHLTHDWEGPLARSHFRIEGNQLFTGLLFIPKRPPFDLFDREQRHGVRLYVKRVFIMDDCDELLPRWLRFLRGVIDSDDLPLNVSREILQDSAATRTIRKQVVKKALDMLEGLSEERPEDYLDFWRKYGLVIKEGIHAEPTHKERLASLMRFDSSRGEGLTSLSAYAERMPMAQKAIYYIAGASRALVEASPQLEAVRQKGYEILYLTDPIDQWVVDSLREFGDHKLVSVMAEDLDLGEDEEQKVSREEQAGLLKGLTDRFQAILGDHIRQVRVSNRLTESPVCLVIPEGGLPTHIEMILRANQQDLPRTRRVLEVNPSHPLILNLQQLTDKASGEAEGVKDWVELLYDQALLAEGSPIPDPAKFAARMTTLMQQATGAAVAAQ
jgi:molecular chaperone HtpG